MSNLTNADSAKRYLPRPGTIAHNTLGALNRLGRTAPIARLMSESGWTRKQHQFRSEVIERLGVLGFVTVNADICTLTEEALDFLCIPLHEPAPAPSEKTPPRTATAFRPLNLASIRPAILPRVDSLQSLTLPSVMGGAPVRHTDSLAFLLEGCA